MRKSEKLSDAIGMVDEEIVAEAEEKRISFSDNSTKNKRRGNIIRISAAAAACAAVAGGVLLIGGNGGENISDIMSTDAPSVYEYGYVTNKPVSPNIIRNTLIGALLGAFVSIAFVSVLYIMDDTVKTSEDVEKYLKLNTMASIPLREDMQKQKGEKKKDE